MNKNKGKLLKATRKRMRPIKKWTDRETNLILDYIYKKEDFEKPTAQMYYKKLLEEVEIDASWDIIRWKVRNLKQSFIKANELRKSTDARPPEPQEGFDSIQVRITKLCPYYKKLNDIFVNKNIGNFFEKSLTKNDSANPDESEDQNLNFFNYSPLLLQNTENDDVSDAAFTPKIENINEDSSNLITTTTSAQISASTSVPAPQMTEESMSLSKKSKKCSPKLAISQLISLQSEMQVYYGQKLQFQKQKFTQDKEFEERKIKLLERELEIQERKLKIQEDKLRHEQELKRQEFELKRLEMDKEERIAKFEIEMKYKNSK